MGKLRVVILFLITLATQVAAQDTIHLCVGESHNFAVPYTNGSSYDWKIQNTTIATIISGNGSENITMDLNYSGTVKLIVEELNTNGCFGYDSILVEIHDLPTPVISTLEPNNICEGVDVLLKINNMYESYLWSDGSSGSELLVDTSGDYSVFVTDEFNCKNLSNSILINIQSDFLADFYFKGICVNNPTTFFNTSVSLGSIINSLSWDFGDGFQYYSDSVLYSYKLAGDYQVSLFIETAAGCKDSIIKTITVFENPKANFNYNPSTVSTLNPEINFINTSTNGTSYLWSFGDSIYSTFESPSHFYDYPGLYDIKLIVVDSNHCIDSVMQGITIYYDFVLYLPAAFTPNADGNNDQFGPQGLRLEEYKSYSFDIYNKWGEIIFETEDINEWWDGANSQNGSYAWSIVIVDEIGKKRKKEGNVILIK